MATSSYHISKILIHISHARQGRAGSTLVSAVVPSLRECPVVRSQEMEDIDVSKGARWKICLAALQVVFKNVCYFSPFNVDIFKNVLTFAKPNAVSGCIARVDFGMSGCPDDPDGNNCGKAISTKQSIALYIWKFLSMEVYPKNAGWFISWKIPSRNG